MSVRLAAMVLSFLAPSPAAAAEQADANRLFWVIPNYRTVEEERKIVPLATREKFALAAKDSFDPYAFPVAGFYAGLAHARNEYAEWGRGPEGFGKRYAGAFADQTVSNYMTEAVFPTFLHEDPRYFRLGRGGFWHRAGYAVSRVFVIRTDDGGREFNYSEFGGNAVMSAAADAYYPRSDRTISATANRWGVQIGLDMVFNVAKEFWPDIRRGLTGY
ncbi:MAG: hypothetical protein ACHQ51_00515 [Elusimicrobiota bacterium]